MGSPVEQVTVWGRYAFAATVARTADAGAAVGVVLLAAAGSGAGGVRLGGLLAAALTAPPRLGARIGRLVARARDPRRPSPRGASATPRRSRRRPVRSGSACPWSGRARW